MDARRTGMPPRLRAAHELVGVLLMAGSVQVWGLLQFMWAFPGGPGALERYGLRPYRFASPAAQLWFQRLLEWGWPLLAAVGLILLVLGILNRPAGKHRAWWLVGWGVAPMALVMAMVLCHDQSGLLGLRIGSVEGLGHWMHLEFPANTRLVVACMEPGPDCFAWGVVTMPTPEVLPFLRNSLKQSVHTSASEPSSVALLWDNPSPGFWYSPEVPAWHPERAKKPLTAYASPGGKHGVTVVADMGAGAEATVYLLR